MGLVEKASGLSKGGSIRGNRRFMPNESQHMLHPRYACIYLGAEPDCFTKLRPQVPCAYSKCVRHVAYSRRRAVQKEARGLYKWRQRGRRC